MAKRKKSRRSRRRSRGLSGTPAEHAAARAVEHARAKEHLHRLEKAVAARECDAAMDNYEWTVRALTRAATHAGMSEEDMTRGLETNPDSIASMYHRAETLFYRGCKVVARAARR